MRLEDAPPRSSTELEKSFAGSEATFPVAYRDKFLEYRKRLACIGDDALEPERFFRCLRTELHGINRYDRGLG